jgi:hypothetical protein
VNGDESWDGLLGLRVGCLLRHNFGSEKKTRPACSASRMFVW